MIEEVFQWQIAQCFWIAQNFKHRTGCFSAALVSKLPWHNIADAKKAVEKAGDKLNEATPNLSANPLDDLFGKVSLTCLTRSATSVMLLR